MENNFYIRDILDQPQALRLALDKFDAAALEPLRRSITGGEIDRIILTGMGASYFASYPASLILARSGLPVIWMDTAELLHYAPQLITPRTLLWLASQSGRSAEIVALLEQVRSIPAVLLATVNDLASPLAEAAALLLPLHAAPEKTVSTRTCLNTLALGQLAALYLTGGDVTGGYDDLQAVIPAMQAYLERWPVQLAHMEARLGEPQSLFLLGRGPSLAPVFGGALVLQEAAKFPASAQQAAEFRHGPLELAGPDLTAVVFGGPPETRALNLRLFDDLRARDTHVLWLDPGDGVTPATPVVPSATQLPMPAARGIARPLAEMLPVQIMSVYLSRMTGFEVGQFLHIGKVTQAE